MQDLTVTEIFAKCVEVATAKGSLENLKKDLIHLLKELEAPKSWADRSDTFEEEEDLQESVVETKVEAKADTRPFPPRRFVQNVRPQSVSAPTGIIYQGVMYKQIAAPRPGFQQRPAYNANRVPRGPVQSSVNTTPAFIKKEGKWVHPTPVKVIEVKDPVSDSVPTGHVKRSTSLGWFLGETIPEDLDRFLHELDSEGNPIGWVRIAHNIWKSNPKMNTIHIKSTDGVWYHFDEYPGPSGRAVRNPLNVEWLRWVATPKVYRTTPAPSKF
jgi:hypothetical protein